MKPSVVLCGLDIHLSWLKSTSVRYLVGQQSCDMAKLVWCVDGLISRCGWIGCQGYGGGCDGGSERLVRL